MTKYLFSLIIILLVSCKQANGNLDTNEDTIKPQDTAEKIDKKLTTTRYGRKQVKNQNLTSLKTLTQ